MEKQPPNYYGNNYSNQPYPNQNMGINPNYNNPYVNNQMPDYPLPNAGNDNNSNDKTMANDSNCISDLCKMNKGKSITVYCTFTDSAEWHDKVFKGILYSAGDDNIIIYNPQDGKFTVIVSVYVNFVEFYDLDVLSVQDQKKDNGTSQNNKE